MIMELGAPNRLKEKVGTHCGGDEQGWYSVQLYRRTNLQHHSSTAK
jgi:hypothetical protein